MSARANRERLGLVVAGGESHLAKPLLAAFDVRLAVTDPSLSAAAAEARRLGIPTERYHGVLWRHGGEVTAATLRALSTMPFAPVAAFAETHRIVHLGRGTCRSVPDGAVVVLIEAKLPPPWRAITQPYTPLALTGLREHLASSRQPGRLHLSSAGIDELTAIVRRCRAARRSVWLVCAFEIGLALGLALEAFDHVLVITTTPRDETGPVAVKRDSWCGVPVETLHAGTDTVAVRSDRATIAFWRQGDDDVLAGPVTEDARRLGAAPLVCQLGADTCIAPPWTSISARTAHGAAWLTGNVTLDRGARRPPLVVTIRLRLGTERLGVAVGTSLANIGLELDWPISVRLGGERESWTLTTPAGRRFHGRPRPENGYSAAATLPLRWIKHRDSRLGTGTMDEVLEFESGSRGDIGVRGNTRQLWLRMGEGFVAAQLRTPRDPHGFCIAPIRASQASAASAFEIQAFPIATGMAPRPWSPL